MTKEEAKTYEKYYKRKAKECEANIKNKEKEISNKKNEKSSLEKRKEDIEDIIKRLSNINDNEISIVNSQAQKAETSYQNAIILQDISAQSISNAFKTSSIEKEGNTYNALSSLKRELQRIETAIKEIELKIRNLSNSIDSLNRTMKNYNGNANYYSDKARWL